MLVCIQCRYPEKHSCKFDFMEEAKKKLEKDNPVVSGEKIQKI
jgi:hypothetical protein